MGASASWTRDHPWQAGRKSSCAARKEPTSVLALAKSPTSSSHSLSAKLCYYKRVAARRARTPPLDAVGREEFQISRAFSYFAECRVQSTPLLDVGYGLGGWLGSPRKV